ncbi:MAG: hypothetical protein M3P51_12480 [Chloroflexota bacterium]|nr:hypothetical protein [Chloroflexota bacterium]
MSLTQPQIDTLGFIHEVNRRDGSPPVFVVHYSDHVYLRVGNTDEAPKFPASTYNLLLRSNYIAETPPLRPGQGTQVTILPLGIRVVEEGFKHIDPNASAVQNIHISGGNFGNTAFSLSGSISITNSPVSQTNADIGQLLQQLVDSIDESDLPPDAKDDAKVEASQIALELQKKRLDLPEVERHVSKLGSLVAGATKVVVNFDRFVDAVRVFGS